MVIPLGHSHTGDPGLHHVFAEAQQGSECAASPSQVRLHLLLVGGTHALHRVEFQDYLALDDPIGTEALRPGLSSRCTAIAASITVLPISLSLILRASAPLRESSSSLVAARASSNGSPGVAPRGERLHLADPSLRSPSWPFGHVLNQNRVLPLSDSTATPHAPARYGGRPKPFPPADRRARMMHPKRRKILILLGPPADFMLVASQDRWGRRPLPLVRIVAVGLHQRHPAPVVIGILYRVGRVALRAPRLSAGVYAKHVVFPFGSSCAASRPFAESYT